MNPTNSNDGPYRFGLVELGGVSNAPRGDVQGWVPFPKGGNHVPSPTRAVPSPRQSLACSQGPSSSTACGRPAIRGKFIYVGDQKLYIRGVTYGTFRPDEQGEEFPDQTILERDFAQMAANGVNTVRTYTPAPRRLLDAAQRHGLWVLVGLPVERSVAFLDYRKCAQEIEAMVRAEVRGRAGHPAILAYTIGNEIPASIVRWHGRNKLERFLRRLYEAAKDEDPGCLVSYVNYPSTEYLRLPFLDFASFNVYLESQKCLDAYLARLHNIAGDRPLVMARWGWIVIATVRPPRRTRWIGRSGPRSPRAVPAFLSTRGRMSGSAEARRWTIGSSASRTGSGVPNRRWRRCGSPSMTCRSRAACPGRACRSWFAATMGHAPSATAWRRCRNWNTPTSR